MNRKKSPALVMGKALLFASLQFAVASVEMSSKFSAKTSIADQNTLNHAADSLSDFILVATVWAVGSSLTLYACYGLEGLIASVVSNILIVLWIVLTYISTFRDLAKRYNLQMPKLFNKRVD